jgi:hypothetical protein
MPPPNALASDFTDRLRVREAAAIAKVSPGLIYSWLASGYFKTWVVTRRSYTRGVRFIDRASFEKFLQSQRDQTRDASNCEGPGA